MSDDQSCIENASRCCSGTSRAIRGVITEQSLKTPKTRALVSYLESSQYRSVEHASQPEWNPKDSQREAVHDQLLLDSFERSTLRDSTALNGQELRVSSAHSGQYLMPVRPMFPRNGDEMDSLECSPLVESLKVGWTRMNRVCDFPFDRELDRAKKCRRPAQKISLVFVLWRADTCTHLCRVSRNSHGFTGRWRHPARWMGKTSPGESLTFCPKYEVISPGCHARASSNCPAEVRSDCPTEGGTSATCPTNPSPCDHHRNHGGAQPTLDLKIHAAQNEE